MGQNGELTISLKPPIHIVDFFQEKFKIKATDSMNETISTDWFYSNFLPIAEEVELTRGFNRDPLEEISLGSSANKEFLIDLQRVININAFESNEHLGDKTYL